MTENEAIKELETSIDLAKMCTQNYERKSEIQGYEMAIQALEEVQQYRQIGTVEECRTAVEKQTAIDPEKVAEQIEDIKTGANTNCRMDCSNYDWSTGSCQGLCEKYLKKRAIEIVKAGGTDDKK